MTFPLPAKSFMIVVAAFRPPREIFKKSYQNG